MLNFHRLNYRLRRLEEICNRLEMYLHLRLRVLLLRGAVRWAPLRRLLRQGGLGHVRPRVEHLHHLWQTSWICTNCSEAHGQTVEFPLGDCNLSPVQEPQGFTKTVLVFCPICNCAGPPRHFVDTGSRQVFDFSLGQFTGMT